MIALFSTLIVAAYIWLTWQNRARALALIPALSPLYLIRFQLGPLPTTLLELLALIALGAWLLSKPRIHFTKAECAVFGLLLVVVGVGAIAAPNALGAIGIAKAYYIEPALLLLAFKDTLKAPDWQFGLRALGCTALLLGIFSVFQVATGLGLAIPYDFLRRATSVFPYPNAYGLFVTPLVVLFGTLAAREKNRIYAGLACFLFVTLFLSQTEAGIVAVLASAGAFALTALKTTKAKLALVAAGVLVLISALALPQTRTKLLLEDTSGLVRRSQWSETMPLIQDHVLTGVGFNGYPEAFAPYHKIPQYEIFQYPHNFILNAWVEAGLLNVVFVLVLLSIVLYTGWKYEHNTLRLGAALALLSMFIHGLVDVPFYKNDLAVVTAFLFAVMLYVAYDSTSPHNHPPTRA